MQVYSSHTWRLLLNGKQNSFGTLAVENLRTGQRSRDSRRTRVANHKKMSANSLSNGNFSISATVPYNLSTLANCWIQPQLVHSTKGVLRRREGM